MKKVLKKIWNIIKKVYGVMFILCTILSVSLYFDEETQILPCLMLTGICGYLAYICFKKPKKKTTAQTFANINTPKNVDIQQNISPSFATAKNDTGVTYIFDERDKFVGRSDGNWLTEEDSVYLSQIYLEKAIEKDAEIKSRGLTSNIITDEPLNDNEILFFNAFSEKLLEAKLNPGYVSIERLGSGTLNVTYYGIYVGKIFLAEIDTVCKYRVMKIGNTRATRVFDDRKSAEHYIKDKIDYYIEEHKTHISNRMQCLIGTYKVADMDNIDVNTAINTIPKWIKYIKRSMRDFI